MGKPSTPLFIDQCRERWGLPLNAALRSARSIALRRSYSSEETNMKLVYKTVLACLGFAVAGCANGQGDESDPEVEQTSVATDEICGVSFPLEKRLSLMVTQPVDDDPADPLTGPELTRLNNVWNAVKPKFSFDRVISQIRATSGAPSPNTNAKLYNRWMDSYNDTANAKVSGVRHCDNAAVDPNDFGLECPRPEGALADAAFDPFTGAGIVIEPIAIVNRFDLAPTSGATCGEHRIIFAMKSNGAGIARLFYIFEAALPNPTPAAGLAGCAAVVDRWQSLSDPALTPAQIANRLEGLFFTGLPGFSPVVHANNYGLGGAGQIRTNQLSSSWTLREFKTQKSCPGGACTLSFAQVTTKTNPADDLFDTSHPMSAAFESNFLLSVTKSRLGAKTAATIKMVTGDAFNSWESNQGETAYDLAASSAFRADVNAAAVANGLGIGQKDVLERAQTQSCMGCHQESNGRPLGLGVTWPSSAGFVHVTETGSRSQSLTASFLPRRAAVFQKAIDSACTGQLVADDGLTLAGSPVGNPN
jgi:hypothetical protein